VLEAILCRDDDPKYTRFLVVRESGAGHLLSPTLSDSAKEGEPTIRGFGYAELNIGDADIAKCSAMLI
jgi:hypothetical protein